MNFDNTRLSPKFVEWLQDKSIDLHQLHSEYLIDNRNISTDVVEFVCDKMGVDSLKMLSECRKNDLAVSRFICFAVLRVGKKLTYKEIGELMGNRTHATIISGLKSLGDIYDTRPDYKKTINSIFEHFGFTYKTYQSNRY